MPIRLLHIFTLLCFALWTCIIVVQKPSFHVSLLWCLGDVRHLLDDCLLSDLQVNINRLLSHTVNSLIVGDYMLIQSLHVNISCMSLDFFL